ncbi:hypothetical protein XM74_c10009 [Vibrio vulnificus]|nr:hypothetical protein XM74_c10009 [Vibrio vulnificus]
MGKSFSLRVISRFYSLLHSGMFNYYSISQQRTGHLGTRKQSQ